jgi:Glutathione peroxidase
VLLPVYSGLIGSIAISQFIYPIVINKNGIYHNIMLLTGSIVYKDIFIFSSVFVQISDFDILAFPCNQFLSQEPGSSEDVKEFACTRFKAEYPIFQKVKILSGCEEV